MLNINWKLESVKIKLVKPYGANYYEVYLTVKDSEEFDIFLRQYNSLYDAENFAPRFAYELNLPYEFVDENEEC